MAPRERAKSRCRVNQQKRQSGAVPASSGTARSSEVSETAINCHLGVRGSPTNFDVTCPPTQSTVRSASRGRDCGGPRSRESAGSGLHASSSGQCSSVRWPRGAQPTLAFGATADEGVTPGQAGPSSSDRGPAASPSAEWITRTSTSSSGPRVRTARSWGRRRTTPERRPPAPHRSGGPSGRRSPRGLLRTPKAKSGRFRIALRPRGPLSPLTSCASRPSTSRPGGPDRRCPGQAQVRAALEAYRARR